MKGLDQAHRRPAGPEQLAGRGRFEADREVAEMDWAEASIGMDHYLRRDCVGEAEIVGGSHAIDEHADLVSPSHGVDHLTRIGRIALSREPIDLRSVIKSVVDAADIVCRCEPLERLANGVIATEVKKIVHGPHAGERAARNPRENKVLEVTHVPKRYTNLGQKMEAAFF